MLDGKIAVVTGGGSGIGRATSLRLARSGARVVIGDINAAGAAETCALIEAAGGSATTLELNVAERTSVEGFFAQVEERFGRFDIAVNNAGISGSITSFASQEEADFDATLAINLKGVWLCLKAELPLLEKFGGGAIVNTASALGLIGSVGGGAYTASKHGVVGLTKAAALEYAARGIRVNAVCPGVIPTALTSASLNSNQAMDRVVALHPIGRLGTPEEIAEAIFWLASPAASFVTGAALSVDGGWTAQ